MLLEQMQRVRVLPVSLEQMQRERVLPASLETVRPVSLGRVMLERGQPVLPEPLVPVRRAWSPRGPGAKWVLGLGWALWPVR